MQTSSYSFKDNSIESSALSCKSNCLPRTSRRDDSANIVSKKIPHLFHKKNILLYVKSGSE